MKRRTQIALAWFKCHVHLLLAGLWRGQCIFEARNYKGQITLIAAVKTEGTTLQILHIFYATEEVMDLITRSLKPV